MLIAFRMRNGRLARAVDQGARVSIRSVIAIQTIPKNTKPKTRAQQILNDRVKKE